MKSLCIFSQTRFHSFSCSSVKVKAAGTWEEELMTFIHIWFPSCCTTFHSIMLCPDGNRTVNWGRMSALLIPPTAAVNWAALSGCYFKQISGGHSLLKDFSVLETVAAIKPKHGVSTAGWAAEVEHDGSVAEVMCRNKWENQHGQLSGQVKGCERLQFLLQPRYEQTSWWFVCS